MSAAKSFPLALDKRFLPELEAARSIPTEKTFHEIGVFGGLTVGVAGKLTGLRVTTTDQAAGISTRFIFMTVRYIT